MNARWIYAVAAATAAFLPQGLWAAASGPIATQQHAPLQSSPSGVPVLNLVGATVSFPQPRKLGQIEDIVLDPQTGQAMLAVLDADIPGVGRTTLVVPYQALQVVFNPVDHRDSVVLNVRADRLPYAPRIENDQWTLLQNPQFLAQVRNFYSAQPYMVARPLEVPSAEPAAIPNLCAPTVRQSDEFRSRNAPGPD